MIMYTNKLRSIKISALFVRNRWSSTAKPKLTLSGDWMHKAGFTIGMQVTIEVEADRLIIKRPKDEFQG
jgi:hypothetical protein